MSDAPAPRPENEMSAAFREQARRAFDAVERVPQMGSEEYPHAGFETRKLDAEKAIDEAKYKIQTAKDKEVHDLLDAALWGRTGPEERHLLDPDSRKLIEMGIQCEVELRAEFEPENLTDLGRNSALQKTCLAQRKTILSDMQQRQRKTR